VIEEEEDDADDVDDCWLAELAEPEEAHFAKPMSAGEKESSRSLDIQDLPSSHGPSPPRELT
jgi:hypothetical protein